MMGVGGKERAGFLPCFLDQNKCQIKGFKKKILVRALKIQLNIFVILYY